jgi:hypothetical protein
MTLIFLNIPGLIGEIPSKLILAYPVIELFRTRVTSNASAGSVKKIVERQNRDGGWQLVSGVNPERRQNGITTRNDKIYAILIIQYKCVLPNLQWCRRGSDCMVVGFITTYAISTYHH